ncbi:THO complex subunit 1 transcription elongation factor-domain-containing protein [Crepidotus variabilis]|uniref:THO complex subunit 1 transcription elongation factor-domain-containing protein n=1 Tax=Crepidotus variabilis TaxID=179855 RepID=A0A9P6EMZ2_9AGAR|nr:THO complex subunit 1 transcription elongation factor-domain-containing protein [Crepidotus variabilis]
MVFLEPYLASLLKSLPAAPVEEPKLRAAVSKTLEETQIKLSLETRKAQWEFLLKSDILKLAATEGAATKSNATKYYDELCDKLDLILLFTENDACDQTFPFVVLQDLLETQTIASCSHIFSWIESRAQRLTQGMVPQKGKALILLRTLNDLLRRLSKMGSTTIFCGRILTFLSGVFPLGERSGVNLRGEYGPTWEGVQLVDKSKLLSSESGMKVDELDPNAGPDENKMQVDSKQSDNFYNTFWSLQLPFSKPPVFANKDVFKEFQDAVTNILPVIKEATAKEKAMMGSRSGAHGVALKRKREPDEESNSNEYFFAKFLTSPDLLDLEIADTHFRRQVLFQLLVLLHYLSNFTKAVRPLWISSKNRSVQLDFTLEDNEAQWVQEATTKVVEELRQTTPNGRVFADTATAIIEREKNWVKWKNDLCTPFDKDPWSEVVDDKSVGLFEATEGTRRQLREQAPDWRWSLGTEPLTEIWEMGYNDLRDLENPFQPGDVKDFVKKIKQEDARISLKRQRLQKMAKARAAAAAATNNPVPAPATPESKLEHARSDAPGTLTAPSRTVTGAASPLHPSLPPKPGTPSKPPSTSQDSSKIIAANQPTALAAVPTPARVSTPVPPAPVVEDPEIAKYEENKQRWAWLALRAARDQHLQHFGKIGAGDIELLLREIEKEAEKGPKVDEGPNVLVTGGAGYIGSHVIYVLQKTRRYKVIALDNHHNSSSGCLDRVSELTKSELPADATEDEKLSAEIDVHKCDLTKPDQIRAVFEKYGKEGVWGVVHIAAYKAVGESTEIPLTYYANNVCATVSLLQVMDEFDCRRLVYSSSATVYGTPPVIPIPETTRLEAHSPYGKTKIMSETIIDDLCHADKRWRALSLRYFNPAGAHPSGMIGEDPRGRPGNLLPLLAHMAVGRVKDSTLKVFGDDYPTPDGTCVRDYLHVMDLASGHLLSLDALAPESFIFKEDATAYYKAYNLGKGQGVSVLQIVDAMRKATGFDFKHEVIGRRRGDVPDLTADPALAERDLGFKAPADLTTMCRDLWNWQQKNPMGYGEQLVNGVKGVNGINGVKTVSDVNGVH